MHQPDFIVILGFHFFLVNLMAHAKPIIHRSINTFSLLLTSISAIIGSGWLFSAYYTAKIAGPAASLAWLIGGLFAVVIAFVFAEICSMIPVSGSSVRIPHYTHGSVLSFMFAWIIWLSYLALMATEVQAVIQYVSLYIDGLLRPDSGLSHKGYLFAAGLMFLVSFINVYSVRWLIRSNSILTVLKIAIPLVIIFIVFKNYFNPLKIIHPVGSSFMPNGWQGVFSALTTGGIVFAFNGFKQAAELAGEAEKPEKSVSFAIIGSIGICLLLFLLLQTLFFSSLTAQNLVDGWGHLHLANPNSPLASILIQDQLAWLLPLLYFAAIIAPLAAALMYCSSASRSLFGMSKNGYIPAFFQKITPQGNPHWAILTNFVLGLLFFAPLPGWNAMVSFLTSLLAVTYCVGPICLLALRYQVPDMKRPLRLPLGHLWAYSAFVICTFLIYWSGWVIISKLSLVFILGAIILIIYHARVKNAHHLAMHWRTSTWLWVYIAGLTLLSYVGNEGGKGYFSFGELFAAMLVFCALVAGLAVRFKLPASETLASLEALKLTDGDGIK